MRRSFTIEQDHQIATLYNSGLSSIKLAKQFEVDKSTILDALKRQGIKKRRSTYEPTTQDKIAGMKMDSRTLLTPSEAEQAYKIYEAGYSLNQISMAYRFGKNGRGLARCLKSQGYKLRGEKATSKEQDNEIVRLYSEGLSSGQVAKQTNIAKQLVKKRIKESGTGRKHTIIYKYSVNENTFSQIDNEVSAYILGFVYADGSTTDKVLRIMLSEVDKDHLEKMNSLLGSNYPVLTIERMGGYKTTSLAIALQINNPKLIRDLHDCGMVSGRNQFYKTQAKIHASMRHHFIRGYLDGDGCIRGNYNPSVTFVGQEDILTWIRQVFHEELNTNPNLKIMKGKGTFVINYVGINQSTLICNWLYKDATIWLQRKRDKFEKWPEPQNKRRIKH